MLLRDLLHKVTDRAFCQVNGTVILLRVLVGATESNVEAGNLNIINIGNELSKKHCPETYLVSVAAPPEAGMSGQYQRPR